MAQDEGDEQAGLFSGRERLAVAGVFILVGASMIVYALAGARHAPPAATVDGSLGLKPRAPAAAPAGPQRFGPPEAVALLARHVNPPSARFAAEFLATPELRAIWLRYLIDGDLRTAGAGLRQAPQFAALLDRFSADAAFEAAADAVMAEPALAPAVDALRDGSSAH